MDVSQQVVFINCGKDVDVSQQVVFINCGKDVDVSQQVVSAALYLSLRCFHKTFYNNKLTKAV